MTNETTHPLRGKPGPNLRVCPNCGWYENSTSHGCYPEAGRAADALGERLGVPYTKYGYGHMRLTFQFSADMSLTLLVGRDSSFHIERLYCLDDLSVDQITVLTKALTSIAAARTV